MCKKMIWWFMLALAGIHISGCMRPAGSSGDGTVTVVFMAPPDGLPQGRYIPSQTDGFMVSIKSIGGAAMIQEAVPDSGATSRNYTLPAGNYSVAVASYAEVYSNAGEKQVAVLTMDENPVSVLSGQNSIITLTLRSPYFTLDAPSAANPGETLYILLDVTNTDYALLAQETGHLYYDVTGDYDYLAELWGNESPLYYFGGIFTVSWHVDAPQNPGTYYWQAEILLDRFTGVPDGSGNHYSGRLFFPCRAFNEVLSALTVGDAGGVGIIIQSEKTRKR
ncbi:MAG: hypothetical protein ACM3WV_00550 [Bacillota bacterium]